MELYNKLINKYDLDTLLDDDDGIFIMDELKRILAHYEQLVDPTNNDKYKLFNIKYTIKQTIKENLYIDVETYISVKWIDNYLHVKTDGKYHYIFMYCIDEDKFELLFSCLENKYYNIFGNFQTKAELKNFIFLLGVDIGIYFYKLNDLKDTELHRHTIFGMRIYKQQRKYNIIETIDIIGTNDDFYKHSYIII